MIELRAHAKVNLFLKVLGLRPDGFHAIESVFHSIGLSDDVAVESTDRDGIELDLSQAAGVPSADNTVRRAAASLAWPGGVAISLRKRIPIGAGLGGGSADAAATLLALDRLWDLGLGAPGLLARAAEIGSDVPYCLTGGPMLVTGRGETLAPIDAPVTLWLVLGISREGLSTAEVYARWDEVGRTTDAVSGLMADALIAGDLEAIASLLHNDLESAAFDMRPGLADAKGAMTASGALGALMSGSGPTIFGLCRDEAEARAVAARVADRFDRVEVAPTVTRSVEMLGLDRTGNIDA